MFNQENMKRLDRRVNLSSFNNPFHSAASCPNMVGGATWANERPKCPRVLHQTMPRRPRCSRPPAAPSVRAGICPPMHLLHPLVVQLVSYEGPLPLPKHSCTCEKPWIPWVIPPILLGNVEIPPPGLFGSTEPIHRVGTVEGDGGSPRRVNPKQATVVPPLFPPRYEDAIPVFPKGTTQPLAAPEPVPRIKRGACNDDSPRAAVEFFLGCIVSAEWSTEICCAENAVADIPVISPAEGCQAQTRRPRRQALPTSVTIAPLGDGDHWEVDSNSDSRSSGKMDSMFLRSMIPACPSPPRLEHQVIEEVAMGTLLPRCPLPSEPSAHPPQIGTVGPPPVMWQGHWDPTAPELGSVAIQSALLFLEAMQRMLAPALSNVPAVAPKKPTVEPIAGRPVSPVLPQPAEEGRGNTPRKSPTSLNPPSGWNGVASDRKGKEGIEEVVWKDHGGAEDPVEVVVNNSYQSVVPEHHTQLLPIGRWSLWDQAAQGPCGSPDGTSWEGPVWRDSGDELWEPHHSSVPPVVIAAPHKKRTMKGAPSPLRRARIATAKAMGDLGSEYSTKQPRHFPAGGARNSDMGPGGLRAAGAQGSEGTPSRAPPLSCDTEGRSHLIGRGFHGSPPVPRVTVQGMNSTGLTAFIARANLLQGAGEAHAEARGQKEKSRKGTRPWGLTLRRARGQPKRVAGTRPRNRDVSRPRGQGRDQIFSPTACTKSCSQLKDASLTPVKTISGPNWASVCPPTPGQVDRQQHTTPLFPVTSPSKKSTRGSFFPAMLSTRLLAGGQGEAGIGSSAFDGARKPRTRLHDRAGSERWGLGERWAPAFEPQLREVQQATGSSKQNISSCGCYRGRHKAAKTVWVLPPLQPIVVERLLTTTKVKKPAEDAGEIVHQLPANIEKGRGGRGKKGGQIQEMDKRDEKAMELLLKRLERALNKLEA